MLKNFFVLVTLFSASLGYSKVVMFEIKNGTGNYSWNTQQETVQVQVGDILRVFNNDSITHRLHTNGAPCEHSPDIKTTKFWDCKIQRPYNVEAQGPLYDHYVGDEAAFWINAVP
jgi:hypothetical protein